MKSMLLLCFSIFVCLAFGASELEVHPVNGIDFGCLKQGQEGFAIDPEAEGSGQLYVVGEPSQSFQIQLDEKNVLLENLSGDTLLVEGLRALGMEDSKLDSLGYGEIRVGAKVLRILNDQKPGLYQAEVMVRASSVSLKGFEFESKSRPLEARMNIKICIH